MSANRYRKVAAHRKLMAMADAEDLDIDGVRAVLKELINAAIPVSADEMAVIAAIESERDADAQGYRENEARHCI